jgi:hypothetical protein
MRALINPDDLEEFCKLHPDADVVVDTWGAIPRGKYVDLEVIERHRYMMEFKPMPMPKMALMIDDQDAQIKRALWRYCRGV